MRWEYVYSHLSHCKDVACAALQSAQLGSAWLGLCLLSAAAAAAAAAPSHLSCAQRNILCASLCCVLRSVITVVSQMQRKAKVDVAIWAGLVPENAHDPALLQGLLDQGALGFKSFMSPAGRHTTLLILLLKQLLPAAHTAADTLCCCCCSHCC